MKLTTKGRYAVMAMADLASNSNAKPISLTEIALRQNISLAYLEQIFIKLKNKKLVKSSRGATGGYTLEKPASEIKLSNIIALGIKSILGDSFSYGTIITVSTEGRSFTILISLSIIEWGFPL